MSRYDCRKNQAYHNLLRNYVEHIGRTECPGEGAQLEAVEEGSASEMMRSVGKVVQRHGVWEIHMVRVDSRQPYRLEKQKLRTFSSRKIAEIVARYVAASECDQCAKRGSCPHASGMDYRPCGMDICWN